MERMQSLKEKLASQEKEIAYKPVRTDDENEQDLEDEDQDNNSIGASSTSSKEKSCGLKLVESTPFQNVVGFIIVVNGCVIGLETDCPWKNWDAIEYGFLVIFASELLLKLCVEGRLFFQPSFRDFWWNQFDLLVVGLGVFDAICAAMGTQAGSGGFATVFRMVRLMRILRIFRLLKFLRRLYLLAVGLVEAFKAILWVTVLMTFMLYVCGIVLTRTVGRPPDSDPHHGFMAEHFGTIPDSMITLFILMSSPNLPVYQEEKGLLDARPVLTIFLIGFITFGSFGMLGMLTGVINQSMFENNENVKE